ncbi:uncharacterized protein CEXT_582141 [Caerostris extrusa]|uniref:Uncharacterized protein n=1 Tax=Caerostris extrusa TaxID=172846 RepID=A0AAV4MBA4_CAEEX|nr:uncharacterized protein CEXT_582141 [Caerostris extrusa]
MSYAQFGYAAFPPTTQLMVGEHQHEFRFLPVLRGDSSGRASSGVDSSSVCSLPATYDSRLLTTYHPRLYDHQAYPNFTGVDSSAFYPSLVSYASFHSRKESFLEVNGQWETETMNSDSCGLIQLESRKDPSSLFATHEVCTSVRQVYFEFVVVALGLDWIVANFWFRKSYRVPSVAQCAFTKLL